MMANIFRSSIRLCHNNLRKVSKCQFGKNQQYYQLRCASQTPSDVQETSADKQDSLYKASSKPLTNYPIVKNLFLGKFDRKQLVFPDVLNKEELEELNVLVQPIEKFFNEELDSKAIDEAAKIPDDVLNVIKDLGLFGQQIPPEYGGLGLNATKYARLAEITALDGAIAVTLAAHQAIGLKGILIAGNEEQKQKYLPKLATGEHVAAFALTEPSSGSDAASIQTKATLSEDGTHYLLNGGKIWISNGGIADIFTVFAKTEVPSAVGEKKEKVTAFIVERAYGGVTHGKPEDKLGIRGSNTCEVHFENTPVPVENILGQEGGGFKVAMNILNSGRFSMGSSVAGMHRKLIALTAEHAISRTQFNRKLKDFELIQEKFAKMAIRCYAMESMAYMTAGILDSYQDPDASVEAAVVKIFSSEAAWTSISECVQILGGLGYMRDYPFERYLRDSRILMIFEGTNEILRLYVALTGVQFAGNELRDVVSKTRDPLNNLGFLMKYAAGRMKERKFPSTQLYKELHPTLDISAGILEQSLHKFKTVVELGLSCFGKDLIHEQMFLRRLADIAIDLYAMTAVLARCSRSRSIGLKNCDHEALLAGTFVAEAAQRIEENSKQLNLGKLKNGDEVYKQIADDIFKNHGYVAEHPLERIF